MNNNTDKKKEQRQNLYVTVTVILMMVAVIVAIAVSLAKTGREIESMKYKEETASLSEKEAKEEPDDTEKGAESDSDSSIVTEDVFLNEKEEGNTEGSAAQDGKESRPEEKETAESESGEDKADSAAALPEFTVPVKGEILKGASFDVPVFSRTMEDYRTHTGVDVYCEAGSDVAAVASGTIKEIWEDPMMGTCMSVEHSGGMMSVYKNLCADLPEKVSAGRQVNCGEIIATSGDTALLEIAEESHLHFELYLNGEAVDPCAYIDFPKDPVIGTEE